MKVLRDVRTLEELPLSLSIKQQLHHHLTEPFNGDIAVTHQFWRDVDTQLILIEEGDVDEDIIHVDESTQYLIQWVTENPKFVLLLNDSECPYLLALAIVTSEGAGTYLLAPYRVKLIPLFL